MARLFLACALLAVPAAAIADSPPFAPFADVPDYGAHMTLSQTPGRPSADSRTVAHHGGWTRVDLVRGGRASVHYFGAAGPTKISFARGQGQEYTYLQMVRGTERQSPGWEHESHKTGERETWHGESCDIWDVARHRDRGAPTPMITKLSCVTDDGIELWYSFAGRYVGSSARVVSLTRRPVAPREVEPPADLLDLRSWVDAADELAPRVTAADLPGDVETVLEMVDPDGSGRARLVRTTRRHHPWTYTEDRLGDGSRKVKVENEASRLAIHFETDAAGAFGQLTIHKAPGVPDALPRQAGKAWEPARTETILGEECTWFDMMPGVMDAGLHQCRTSDGLVLQEQGIMRGTLGRLLTAVRIRRGALALADVLPGSEILNARSSK